MPVFLPGLDTSMSAENGRLGDHAAPFAISAPALDGIAGFGRMVAEHRPQLQSPCRRQPRRRKPPGDGGARNLGSVAQAVGYNPAILGELRNYCLVQRDVLFCAAIRPDMDVQFVRKLLA